MVNGNELNDCSKNLICKELDAAVRSVNEDRTARGTVSDDSTKLMCHVLEAIFIHGLNDAFFLKGSRYAKYPEPNFWPFVSKFTHKTVRTQIAGLQQIRSEVGRARVWIRIVLNENVLESYITSLDADKNQLKVFYKKSAFLRDRERIDVLIDALRQLTPLKLAAPTNSAMLNAWTPTPLIMAGLVALGGGTMSRSAGRQSTSLLRRVTDSSASLLSDEGGDGPPASSDSQLIGAGNGGKFQKIGSQSSLFTVGSPQSALLDGDEEEDDRSSVYSYPSLVEGGIVGAMRSTVGFDPALSGTSEKEQTDSAFDPAAEVVVVRRRTRIRKVSRQLSGSDVSRPRSGNTSGGEVSRNASQAALEGVLATITDIDSLTVLVTPSTAEPSDSGYEHATDIDDSKASPPLSAGCVAHFSGEDSGRTSVHNYQLDQPSQLGSSLHGELCALESVSSRESHRHHFSSTTAIDCGSTNPSCLSSFGTEDFSLPVASFNTTLRMAAGKAKLIYDSGEERKISIASSVTSSDEPLDLAGTSATLSSVKTCKILPPTANVVGRWSSPAERLIRQLARQSSPNTIAEAKPISLLFSDSIPISKGNHLVDAVIPTTSSVPNGSIRTRNVFTGEEVLVHILSRTVELPYHPLEIERTSIAEDDDVVVVDHKALQEADEYGVSQDLIWITRVPIERGLDAQDFRCPSCRKSIGGAFGTFKMCNLDCKYYCDDCWRRGDDNLIPARMVWNWDCRRRPICKASRAFLRSIADRPFIRIDRLNPALYEHSQPMERIRGLRVRLSLAVMYLFSCKQSVAEDVRRRIFPHDYYHNDIHLYSITDLEGVLNGVMEKRLNALITFCVGHVNACALCFQKGFVCELCQSRRVIYPFQTDIANRCMTCFGVYHTACIGKRACPKCERRAVFCAPNFHPLSPPARPAQ